MWRSLSPDDGLGFCLDGRDRPQIKNAELRAFEARIIALLAQTRSPQTRFES